MTRNEKESWRKGELKMPFDERLEAGRERSKQYYAHSNRSSSVPPSQNVPAEEDAGQGQKRLMNIKMQSPEKRNK